MPVKDDADSQPQRKSNAASWDPRIMSEDQTDIGYQSMDVGRDTNGPATKATHRNVTV